MLTVIFISVANSFGQDSLVLLSLMISVPSMEPGKQSSEVLVDQINE